MMWRHRFARQRGVFGTLLGLLVLFLGCSGCLYEYALGDISDTTTENTDSDGDCPAGYQAVDGLDCSGGAQACESTKLVIRQCTNSLSDCSLWIDGNYIDSIRYDCTSGRENCFAADYDFDLAQGFFVNRVRFMADWHDKRPMTWDLLASDDGVHYAPVMSGQSNTSPWRCFQDAFCTTSVPENCCPGGVFQDLSALEDIQAKWDDFRFTGAVARYWRFRINTTDDPNVLLMFELELYGNECLGSQCSTASCAPGVCTGERPATCACLDCQPTAYCTSAFVDTGPGCVTPDSGR